MIIEMRDKLTGWCLATYVVSTVRQARERLRQILRHEEDKRDKFLQEQAEAREHIRAISERWVADLGMNATPEQMQAIKELQKLAQQQVRWDGRAIEYKNRKKGL